MICNQYKGKFTKLTINVYLKYVLYNTSMCGFEIALVIVQNI